MSNINTLKDAFSGALAAVISAFVVYPFEILRIRRQIELSLSSLISWSDIFSKALSLRLTHTAVTSLIYYSFYETFKKSNCFDFSSKYSNNNNNSNKWKFLSNFLSANIAGILTVTMTVPLDVMVINEQVNNEKLNNQTNNDTTTTTTTTTNGDNNNNKNINSNWDMIVHKWRGITPSLLLCLNPAIHYSVYDLLKYHVITYKNSSSGGSSSSSSSSNVLLEKQLHPFEGFLIGTLAKVCATVVTYPLLTSKITMMTSSNSNNNDNDTKKMMKILYFTFIIQGFAGLYKGVHFHIMNTSIRAAMSMALREYFMGYNKK